MDPVKFDADTASLVAAIAASLAAVASTISAIISAITLRRITKQTDILAKQFEASEPASKETARPRLTVEVSNYRPPAQGQLRSDVIFTLRNAGNVGFQVVHVRTQSGNTQNEDVTRSMEVHPGYPAEIVVNILPPGGYNPPILKAWFEIVTLDMRRQHAAEWEMRDSQFALLKSEMSDVL
jgi:hypothetical protein